MALGERATLVTELRLDDKMTAGLAKAGRGLSKFDSVAGKAGKGLKTLGANLAKIGVAAGVAGAALAGVAIKSGISSLAELEDATTAVDGALRAVGKTGKLTSVQIATWANEIEASVQAAFDDKAITAGAASLLRYGKVAAKDLRPAMVIMTDLAAKTGDVGGAADLLAKALAAPTKATRLLRQVGVTLTKAEEDQVKAFEEAGKLGKAQEIILRKVATATKGAAAAAKGPYNDALNELGDITEDTQRALGEGFLPVIKEVAGFLRTQLAKPEVMQGIRDVGKGLASGFQAAVNFAKQIPWEAVVGAARGIAGFAKQALDLFNMMPDWAKQLLIGGFVANKLTGGAIGSIVKELGSGLIKGVLGIQAGVVNVTGGVVNGPGGGPSSGGKGLLGGLSLGAILPAAALAGFGAAMVGASVWLQEEGRKRAARGDPGETFATMSRNAATAGPTAAWALVAEGARTGWGLKPAIDALTVATSAHDSARIINPATGFTTEADPDRAGIIQRVMAKTGKAPTTERVSAILAKNLATTKANDAREATRIARLTDATRSGLSNVANAANSTTAAVNRWAGFTIPAPVVNTTVTVTGFTVRTLARKTAVNRSINPAPIPGRGLQPK